MCLCACPSVLCVSGVRRCPQRSEEDSRCSGTGIIVEIATGVLGTEPVSSTRAVNELSCWTILPTLSPVRHLLPKKNSLAHDLALSPFSFFSHVPCSPFCCFCSFSTHCSFSFSRPYCPTDSPHDNSHALPHHSWKEYFPVFAYVCTKLL